MTEENTNILDSIEQVAERLGKSVRTIYRWTEQGMPVLQDGRFDLEAILLWRKAKKGSVPPGQAAATDPGANPKPIKESGTDKDWWDKESKKYQALHRELEFRKKKGELIEFRRVEDLFVARIQTVKQGLSVLERSLPQDLIACRSEREMSDVIRKAVRQVLEKFSKPLPPDMVPPTATGSELNNAK